MKPACLRTSCPLPAFAHDASRVCTRRLQTLPARERLGARPAAALSENGSSSSTLDITSLPVLEINGKQYIAVDQARAAMTASNEAATKEAVRLLEEKLREAQEAIKGKDEQLTSLRQESLDAERKSRALVAKSQDQDEQLTALREKVRLQRNEIEQAQESEKKAMEVALEKVEAKLSDAYQLAKDTQLRAMNTALDAAVKRADAQQGSNADATRSASMGLVSSSEETAERVGRISEAAITLAHGRADSAAQAAAAALDATEHVRKQQVEASALAQQLLGQSRGIMEHAAAGRAEVDMRQKEIELLRKDMAEAVKQRDHGLHVAAQRQAHAVWQMRHTAQMCEHRIQEMQNHFEAMKNHERHGAAQARDATDHQAQRCKELEERERDLLGKQQQLQDALAQALARATAAEREMEDRQQQIQEEQKTLADTLKASAAADVECAKAKLAADAQEQARETIARAEEQNREAAEAGERERAKLQQALEDMIQTSERWKDTSRRFKAVLQDMTDDMQRFMKALPGSNEKLKLEMESAMNQHLVALADCEVELENWLPPNAEAVAMQ